MGGTHTNVVVLVLAGGVGRDGGLVDVVLPVTDVVSNRTGGPLSVVNAVWSWIGVGPYGAHHPLAGFVASILIGVVIRPQLVTTFGE